MSRTQYIIAGASPDLISPVSPAQCILWLRSDVGVVHGGTTWEDQSDLQGTALAVSQTWSVYPNQLNGHPGVGTSMMGIYRANWAAPYLNGGTTAFTIYGVWKTNGPPNNGIYANKANPGRPGIWTYRDFQNAKPIWIKRVDDDNTAKIVTTNGLGSQSYGSDIWRCNGTTIDAWHAGIRHQTGADFSGISQSSMDQLVITSWNIHVEWKIWSGALSDEEITNLIEYSTDRYGAI